MVANSLSGILPQSLTQCCYAAMGNKQIFRLLQYYYGYVYLSKFGGSFFF